MSDPRVAKMIERWGSLRAAGLIDELADIEAAGLTVIDATDEATIKRLRRALEDSFWPFLAHDPAKPEVFWPGAVRTVLAALAASGGQP